MNYWKSLACLVALAVALPVSAAARDKDQQKVEITDQVQVGNVQLNPGTYKVEWQNAGPNVKVSFLKGNKVITTVPGTLKTDDSNVVQNDIVTEKVASKTVLREIDFGHSKEALIFNKGA
ncbi:MAG TPA: hypothetical protein VF133_05910 [Terriglobales bacterium]|jgi:hypothetical protein